VEAGNDMMAAFLSKSAEQVSKPEEEVEEKVSEPNEEEK
jgi:hypothetical protein